MSAFRLSPYFLYGTAWKEDATEGLVRQALEAGFRGIDSANQRKHYFEAAVGAALASVLREGRLQRSELFIQTKFTFRDGQDQRLPYDPRAPIAEQVAQSFQSSLEHLTLDALDSLLLHGPSQREGLGGADHEAWRAMEALAGSGRVRWLGVSNVSARQLDELVRFAQVAPSFVQNRCYAERGWDRAVRALCERHGLVYQGFSLLTANRHVLASAALRRIAARHRATPEQIVFRFAQQVGMLPITGTTQRTHMSQDLAAAQLELDASEIDTVMRGG